MACFNLVPSIFIRPVAAYFSNSGIFEMAQTLNHAGSAANAFMRIAVVVGLMMAPIFAVAAAKAGSAPKISGAGLVLIVSLERNA
jgi:hypothetical protein